MSPKKSIPFKSIGQQQPDTVYTKRFAVRAILHNPSSNKIALLHVAKGDYLKLPGGGIEGDEEHLTAVTREIMEETGCKVLPVIDFLAQSEEWRNDLHQISYCYMAKLTEDTGSSELTEMEASEGLTHRWESPQDALDAMKEIQPVSELGRFIKERDSFFVETFLAQGH